MATATTSPMSGPRLFDLGYRTPDNLDQVARDHILRNSQATAEAEIQRLRRDFRRPASLLRRIRRQRQTIYLWPCFPLCPGLLFLEFRGSALNGAASKPTLSKPSYTAVATSGLAAAPASRPPFPAAQVNRQYQQEFPARHQEQPTPPAPPRVDLRVFIRLNEDSLSWDRESYAIRTYIVGRLGIELGRVPQASRTKSGWAVRTADLTTRDLLIQRQLTKPQRDLVRQNGASLFRQHNMEIIAPADATSSSPHPLISSPCAREPPATPESDDSESSQGLPVAPKRKRLEPTNRSMRRKQATPRRRQDPRIFQANVGKSGPSHDCALALADAERFDLILLQEPWTDVKDGRCLTETHPAYDAFSSVDYWEGPSTRPRVITYLRRSPTLLADQLRPSPSRDMLWLHVDDTTFVNVYRQPGVHETLDLLVQWPIPGRCVVVGDFNARHYSWQAGDTTGRGNDIATWATRNDLSLLNPPNKPDQPIRVTSDDELKRFGEIVEMEASALPTQTSSTEGLDALAASLTSMLQSAASRAGHLTRKRARAAPWWNDKCALAAAGHRSMRRIYPLGYGNEARLARKRLQRVVRDTERLFWQALVDKVSSNEDIFKITRWTKAQSPFQPPPLQRKHGNTSPGSDHITVKLLRAAWPAVGNLVRELYEVCLTLGHHPKDFKEAEVVMITKPGKRDLTSPRAWRPMSLLSWLGKGLERLVARRLTWAAVHYAVLHRQQAGALPKRSAVDLVATLVHDIEVAFSQKKGCHPCQNGHSRRIRHGHEKQAHPPPPPAGLAPTAREVGRLLHVKQSSPRPGSPASPILFLLCTEPIYKLGFQLGRFGYADDTAILGTGRTLRETAKLATADVRELISWGAANGITFDPEKTEVMHFSHKKDDTSPSVTHGGIAKVPAEAIRWLGIWLDKKLTFRTHIEKWAAKIQHLVDKLDPVLRRAIRAILPVWKTTPVPIYHQESGIPPVPLLLEPRRIRFAARLKSLDLAHPLAQRTDLTPIVRAVKRSCQVRGGGFKTRLERTALLLCSFPIVPDRPWSKPVTQQPRLSRRRIKMSRRQIFSGGSRESLPTSPSSTQTAPSSQADLGALAPLVGALEGLRAAVKIPDASDNPIVVCLDNLAAATCLRGTASDSSQSAFVKFQEITAAHGSIHVRWIPGHTDIPGNEQADSLANAGCALPEPPDAKPTLAYIRRVAKKQTKEAFQAWWQEHMPEKPALHHLLAARSSHGDFADYHERFNHKDARITCSCGRRKPQINSSIVGRSVHGTG
ncbi:reverse transcriptase domain protein [Metarhizium robertsii]|uniref:Reverse transcriptase domain protein n=1 Tax=Metarhizium robertsii TaxID=568076 RepID=A0A014QQW8_9HYPO|nr:reverse transcriptase domain protein [Metarhizium robertsii]